MSEKPNPSTNPSGSNTHSNHKIANDISKNLIGQNAQQYSDSLDELTLKFPDFWATVKSSDRETCAWNITGSGELDDNLELMGFFQWIQKICFGIAMEMDIELPDPADPDYKQKFANAATGL